MLTVGGTVVQRKHDDKPAVHSRQKSDGNSTFFSPPFQSLHQSSFLQNQNYYQNNSQQYRNEFGEEPGHSAVNQETFGVFSTTPSPVLPQLPPLRNKPLLHLFDKGFLDNKGQFSSSALGKQQRYVGMLSRTPSNRTSFNSSPLLPKRGMFSNGSGRKMSPSKNANLRGVPKNRKHHNSFDLNILQCHRLRRPSDALRLGGIVVEDTILRSEKAEAEAEKKRQEEEKRKQRCKRRERSFLPENWNIKEDVPIVESTKKKKRKKKTVAADGGESGEKADKSRKDKPLESSYIKRKMILERDKVHGDVDIEGIIRIPEGNNGSIKDIFAESKNNKLEKLQDREALVNALSKTSFTALDLQKFGSLELKTLTAAVSAGYDGDGEVSSPNNSSITERDQTRQHSSTSIDLKTLAVILSGASGNRNNEEDGEFFSIASVSRERKDSELPSRPNIDINRLITVLRSKRKDENVSAPSSLVYLPPTKVTSDNVESNQSLSDKNLTMDSAHFERSYGFLFRKENEGKNEFKSSEELKKEEEEMDDNKSLFKETRIEEKEEAADDKGEEEIKEEDEEETEEETEDEVEEEETEDYEQETKEEAKERCENELIKYFDIIFSRRMNAACRIQCVWRCNRARAALHKRQQVLYREVYRKQKAAAMCIEGFFCSVIEKHKLQQKKELISNAIEERMKWERKLILSALIITRYAVVFLRRRREEKKLCKLLAVRTIEEANVRVAAATILARWWKLIPAQKAYWRRRTREVEEQHQNEEKFRQQTHAATQIQRLVRGFLGRQEVLAIRGRRVEEHRSRQRRLHESIDLIRLCLQEYTQRRKRLEREETQRVLQREEAAAVIQLGWKVALRRQMLHNTLLFCGRIVRAVLAIQRVYRRHLAGREIRYLRRVHIAMNKERLDNEYRVFRATMTLQSFARMVIAKRRARQRRAAVGRGYFFAAMTIQSVCRAGVTRARLGCLLHLQRVASVQLQAYIKRQMVQSAAVVSAFLNSRKSCILVETSRCHRLTEKVYIHRCVRYELKLDKCATVIQRAVRRWIRHRCSCKNEERMLQLRSLVIASVVNIQSHVRGFFARRKYNNLRRLLQRCAERREMMEEVGLQMFVDKWREAVVQFDLERRRIATIEARSRELLEQRFSKFRAQVLVACAAARGNEDTATKETASGNINLGDKDDSCGFAYGNQSDHYYSFCRWDDEEADESQEIFSTYDDV